MKNENGFRAALDHLNLTVDDVDRSVGWYVKVLGFEKVEGGTMDGTKWAILRNGDSMLCLYEHPELRQNHRMSHFGIRIRDRDAWEETVRREGVRVAYGGAYRYPRSTSWYVADPSGHEIEVALWDGDEVRF